MKWIKVSDGHHKMVEDDDPRPEDTKWVQEKDNEAARALANGMFNVSIHSRPAWTQEQEKILSKTKIGDAQSESEAAEKIQQIKRDELSKSPTARKREKERKNHWVKNKAEWVKRGRNTSELTQIEK